MGCRVLGVILPALLVPQPSTAEELPGGHLAEFINPAGTANDDATVKFVQYPGLVAQHPDPTTQSSRVRIFSDTADAGVVVLD